MWREGSDRIIKCCSWDRAINVDSPAPHWAFCSPRNKTYFCCCCSSSTEASTKELLRSWRDALQQATGSGEHPDDTERSTKPLPRTVLHIRLARELWQRYCPPSESGSVYLWRRSAEWSEELKRKSSPLWSSGQSSWLHNGDVLCSSYVEWTEYPICK
jgi:hypothetical protein